MSNVNREELLNQLDCDDFNAMFDAIVYRMGDFKEVQEDILNGHDHYSEIPESQREYIVQMLQEKHDHHDKILAIIGPLCQ